VPGTIASAALDPQGQLGQAADVAGVGSLHPGLVEGEVREPAEQFLKRDPGLQPGQRGAQAQVPAGGPVGRPGCVSFQRAPWRPTSRTRAAPPAPAARSRFSHCCSSSPCCCSSSGRCSRRWSGAGRTSRDVGRRSRLPLWPHDGGSGVAPRPAMYPASSLTSRFPRCCQASGRDIPRSGRSAGSRALRSPSCPGPVMFGNGGGQPRDVGRPLWAGTRCGPCPNV
jgi:hypothetical protein